MDARLMAGALILAVPCAKMAAMIRCIKTGSCSPHNPLAFKRIDQPSDIFIQAVTLPK